MTWTDEQIEHFQYLESLRQSGATNMFGATPYLQAAFGLTERQARVSLISWMENYQALLDEGIISRGEE